MQTKPQILEPQKGSNRLKTGFTLIEVVIAVTLFGLITAGTFHLIGLSQRITSSSQDITRITQILHNRMEVMRTEDWATLKSTANSTPTLSLYVDADGNPTSKGNSKVPFNWRAFSMSQSISTVAGKSDLYEVTVQVDWTNHSGVSHSKSLMTRMTKDGLNDYYSQ